MRVNNCQLLSGAVQFLSQRLAFDFLGPSFVVTTRDGLEVKCWDLDDLCWKTTEERTHEGVRGLREGMYIMHCCITTAVVYIMHCVVYDLTTYTSCLHCMSSTAAI